MSKPLARSFALGCALIGVAAGRSDAQRIEDLQQGARIRVETRAFGNVVGTLESATRDTIRVRDGRQTLAFSVADTKSVATSPGPSAVRGMFRTGALAGIVGTIVGAGIGAKTYKPCNPNGAFDCAYLPNSRSQATVFGAVAFGIPVLIIGGVVGAITGSDNWARVALH